MAITEREGEVREGRYVVHEARRGEGGWRLIGEERLEVKMNVCTIASSVVVEVLI